MLERIQLICHIDDVHSFGCTTGSIFLSFLDGISGGMGIAMTVDGDEHCRTFVWHDFLMGSIRCAGEHGPQGERVDLIKIVVRTSFGQNLVALLEVHGFGVLVVGQVWGTKKVVELNNGNDARTRNSGSA